MSTQTREQAWENYDREVCIPRVYDVYQRLIADTAFKAAWSARDAEIARLTADNAALRKAVAVLRAAMLRVQDALAMHRDGKHIVVDGHIVTLEEVKYLIVDEALEDTARFAEEPTDGK